MKIAICDDNPTELIRVFKAAGLYFEHTTEQDAEIKTYGSPLAMLDELDRHGLCDIALLDICMPGMSGIETARELRLRNKEIQLIFLTTSDEYAVDAFALKAAHYILKPFSQSQFDEAMDRAMQFFSDSAIKMLSVKPEGGGVEAVDIREILYVETFGHLLTFHLKSGVITEGRRSLARMLEELQTLSAGQFISPYKGYIVNLKAIRTIETEQIVLRSGDRIPIPKRSFRQIQNLYLDFVFSNDGRRDEVL